MNKKNQSGRLSKEHKDSGGVLGIFGVKAQDHNTLVSRVSIEVLHKLQSSYPKLLFRRRNSISKEEINRVLQSIDKELGQTLFVSDSSIRPDGGLIEVQDKYGDWRVVLVCEAKYQGRDITNIKKGVLVGKKNDKDIMVAGNAIERAHKNISEIANYMLKENYFPYVLW